MEDRISEAFVGSVKAMVEKVYSIAKEKGWHETDRNPMEIAALLHSEVSEFVEEARRGSPSQYEGVGGKPEGQLIELADVVIRVMDYCGKMGWDLGDAIESKIAFNSTRPIRHGNKLY